jgi:hypothetical protein
MRLDNIAARTRHRCWWRGSIAELAVLDPAAATEMARYAIVEDAIYGEYADMAHDGLEAIEIRRLMTRWSVMVSTLMKFDGSDRCLECCSRASMNGLSRNLQLFVLFDLFEFK